MSNPTDWWMVGATLLSGILMATATFIAVKYTENRTARRFEKDKEPRLNFILEKEFDPEPETQGIKTNPSGYRLICQNIGQVPVFIEDITLVFGKDAICYLCPADDQYISAIKPFDSKPFPLNNQEFDNIRYHCIDQDTEKCLVSVSIAGNKSCEAELDIGGILIMYKASYEAFGNVEVNP